VEELFTQVVIALGVPDSVDDDFACHFGVYVYDSVERICRGDQSHGISIFYIQKIPWSPSDINVFGIIHRVKILDLDAPSRRVKALLVRNPFWQLNTKDLQTWQICSTSQAMRF
jgi:hypothetical protein